MAPAPPAATTPPPAALPLLFMGTPAFAVPTLDALCAAGYRPTVVTQPDRPAGRGGRPAAPPVKTAALAHGLTVLQPSTLRNPEVVAQLQALAPQVIVVVAYGELLRQVVLELAPHGCLNVHPSLLPRWRGPTPVPAAILAGDQETGVSVMLLDRGMDSGPVLAQERVPIGAHDTAVTLGEQLAGLGARLLVETLSRWLAGAITPQVQDSAEVTTCPLLTREDGLLDWTQPAEALDRQVRAYTPWPSTLTHWQGKRLKVLAAAPAYDLAPELADPLWANNPPGTVISLPKNAGQVAVAVRAGGGWLELEQVQLEGRAAVPVAAFVAGYPGVIGSRLGGEE